MKGGKTAFLPPAIFTDNTAAAKAKARKLFLAATQTAGIALGIFPLEYKCLQLKNPPHKAKVDHLFA